jgi:SET domain-containing protein
MRGMKKRYDHNTPTTGEKKQRIDYIITTTKSLWGYNSASGEAQQSR